MSKRAVFREKKGTATVMAYFAVGMALHWDRSYEDLLGLLTDGLACRRAAMLPSPNGPTICPSPSDHLCLSDRWARSATSARAVQLPTLGRRRRVPATVHPMAVAPQAQRRVCSVSNTIFTAPLAALSLNTS